MCPQIWESCAWNHNMCHLCHCAMVEVTHHFKLHPASRTSISCVYVLFEHLLCRLISIWMHLHTLAITHVSLDLLGVSVTLGLLGDVNVQMMPLCYVWGCITTQTTSHIHIIHTQCVWVPSADVDRHMDAPFHCYHRKWFPRFVRSGWNNKWWKCTEDATTLCPAYIITQTISHSHPCHTHVRCLSIICCCG